MKVIVAGKVYVDPGVRERFVEVLKHEVSNARGLFV
jgi:hypothetical protein